MAALHAWRWFYGALGATGLLVATSGYFVLQDNPPPKPDLPFDAPAIELAFVATFLPLWGANMLTGHAFGSTIVAIPLVIGLACFVALLLTEYHRREPLSPIEPMWTAADRRGTGGDDRRRGLCRVYPAHSAV